MDVQTRLQWDWERRSPSREGFLGGSLSKLGPLPDLLDTSVHPLPSAPLLDPLAKVIGVVGGLAASLCRRPTDGGHVRWDRGTKGVEARRGWE
jgi:hypothetical protein